MAGRQIEILVRQPGRPDRRITLGEGVTHLGRAEDNDVVLSDIGVSRRHARIVVQATGTWIEDMGSGNGTYYKGHRVRRQALQNGDEILIDPFGIRFNGPGLVTQDDGVTSELEEVDDDDTVPVESLGTDHSGPALEVTGRARLTTLSGQRLAPSYALRDKPLSLGRSDVRDVILFDPAASRDHAYVERVGADFWLRDNNSANGTFVNSHRVKEQCLRHGDRVRIGGTEFRFEVLESEQALPATAPPRPSPSRSLKPVSRLAAAPMTPRAPVPVPVPVSILPDVSPAVHGRGMRVVALAAIGGFAVMGMMIVGGLLALYIAEPDLRLSMDGLVTGAGAEAPAGEDTPEVADPKIDLRVARLIGKGTELFESKQYLESAAQYYSALKIDSGNETAQRMGFAACEYLLVDTMRQGLVLRNLSAPEQQVRRKQAVQLGRNFLRGRADVDEAWSALQEVAVFSPEDRQVSDLLAQVAEKRD